jgi:hypothetical protein
MTPLQSAKNCAAIYSPVTPGVFDSVQSFDAVTVGISKAGDTTCISFAGSESCLDWLRDFQVSAFHHPQLGAIHEGFWQGMGPAFKSLYPLLKGRLSISGHSLGTAHASILAGLCVANGIHVDQLHLFAPPKPGFNKLSLILAQVREVLAYQNGRDPVPEVPVSIPVIAPWRHVSPITKINVSPPGEEAGDPFAWHSLGLYVAGMAQK